MQKGLSRFNFYLDQFQALINTAAKQKNPALWLYSNNARTPLFMLEALTKVYAAFHNKKKFTKLNEQFKLLEDTLGAIDYYDSFAKEFSKNKKIPAAIISYMQAQAREKIQSLNEILTEKKWISSSNERILKVIKKLTEADWLNEKKEAEQLYKFYIKEVKSIVDFAKKTKYHFDNVETDVHELRRKLRWLSIYPQALRGCVQLSKIKKAPAYLDKYLTKEIVSSSFNKMPEAGDNNQFLLLEQNYFYALSWMIAALGKIKDSGLRIIVLQEALQQTGLMAEDSALKEAYKLAGNKQVSIQELLGNAEGIVKTFFDENNLDKLIIGTGAVNRN